jgi:muramoyltetrapeptide carboxypeptidase LdcA involved in peptidoglycan recycling
MKLNKPAMLQRGDLVATVSLSWGGAGDSYLLWRYQAGKAYLENELGLKVIEMEHTLKGSDFIYENPESRAKDLMDAFKNPEIKAIFSNIGGDDSIRLLPYIDFEVIKNNPKIFIGYSDSTITHLMCYHANLSSIYGPSILAEFAENFGMFEYTKASVLTTLFSNQPIGLIKHPELWTAERIEWIYENRNQKKVMQKNKEAIKLLGSGKAKGYLFGGCIEVLEFARGTILWPKDEDFSQMVLFFETSEETIRPEYLEYMLRWYGIKGILNQVQAIIFGKPYQEVFFDEYQVAILKIAKEFHLEIPILYNMPFGHNQPMACLPYGAYVEIDTNPPQINILESAVK